MTLSGTVPVPKPKGLMYSSPLRWVGGKARQARKLAAMMPDTKRYVEAFGGGLSVLLCRAPVYSEIVNDVHGDLVNFWRVVRDKHDELIRSFDFTLCSAAMFEEYKQVYNTGAYKDDVHRAHVFYYLNRACFGGDITNPVFGRSHRSRERSSLRISNIEEVFRRTYQRMQNVVIENRPFDMLIPYYDDPDTFFFLDPPYRASKGYSVGRFTDDMYRTLADICTSMRGTFLMTINDDPLIRDLFAGFRQYERSVYYPISRDAESMRGYGELIIANYDLPASGIEAVRCVPVTYAESEA